MAAHSQSHGINSAIDHEPGTPGTVLGTGAGPALIEKAFGTSAAGNTLVEREADGSITLPAGDPPSPTSAASRAYVDAQIVTGVTWKELVLACEQLVNDPNGGVSPGILISLVANLTAGDTFVISDGVTVETWTAVAAAPAAFQFQIGGSAAATLTNLIAAINADSTLWSAIEKDSLDPYFASAPATQGVIYRTAVPAVATDDRVYGTIAGGQAGVRVVAFNGPTQDYRETSGTESDLPAADPAARTFGFSRPSTAVQTGDTHRCAADNAAFTWDGDNAVWQNTDTGTTVTAGDGISVVGGVVSTKHAIPAGTATQQFGALVNDRTSDGTGAALAGQGFNAVKTDNLKIAVDQASNALTLIGILGRLRAAFGTWTSDTPSDKSPSLAELDTYLGNTAGDIGNWGILVESGGPGGRTGTYIAYKKANTGALSDYHLVELS